MCILTKRTLAVNATHFQRETQLILELLAQKWKFCHTWENVAHSCSRAEFHLLCIIQFPMKIATTLQLLLRHMKENRLLLCRSSRSSTYFFKTLIRRDGQCFRLPNDLLPRSAVYGSILSAQQIVYFKMSAMAGRQQKRNIQSNWCQRKTEKHVMICNSNWDNGLVKNSHL